MKNSCPKGESNCGEQRLESLSWRKEILRVMTKRATRRRREEKGGLLMQDESQVRVCCWDLRVFVHLREIF